LDQAQRRGEKGVKLPEYHGLFKKDAQKRLNYRRRPSNERQSTRAVTPKKEDFLPGGGGFC